MNLSKPIQASHDRDLNTEFPNPMFTKDLTTGFN